MQVYMKKGPGVHVSITQTPEPRKSYITRLFLVLVNVLKLCLNDLFFSRLGTVR
jgi:hypothetical protein